MRVFSVARYLIASCLDSILHFVMQFPRRTRAASRKKNNDRQNVLSQTMSGLQSLSQLSALAPTGLSLCLPIVITIIESVEGAKSNQEQCFRLAERVTEIIYAIIDQMAGCETINSDLNRGIGRLTETLETIKLFICQQHKRKYFSRLWSHASDADDIMQLNTELDHAMALFDLKSHIVVQRKLEVLQILLEDHSIGEKMNAESYASPASSVVGSSMLPPIPPIFYGREDVVNEIVQIITGKEPARVAVLGPGGVGKTSLSLVILHHPTIVALFQSDRWFIQCEGSTTPQGLVSAIANRLELSGDRLFERVIFSFEARRTILVLDNFETPWETVSTRIAIETLLSRLTAIKTLTLLVTMRGSERPAGIAWTRPFVLPLTPLDTNAARLTFVTISDTPKDDPHLEKLLKALDNLPLAITLMANLAQSETPEVLLRRWYLENTAMLTRGPDHCSSLEISITISLDGPRMRQNPDANRLLRLLALLPQGSKDLEEIAPNIQNVHKAATVLKQVGLAHIDGVGSLRVLAPIRRFIIQNYPPDCDSWKPVQTYYENLARLSSEIERGLDGKSIIERLSSQTSNMQAVFEYSLDIPGTNLCRVICAVIDLTDLFKYTGLGSLTTLEKSAAKADAMDEKALLADCIRSQAEIHYSRWSRELATAGFERARCLYKELGDQHLSEQGRCTMMLGMVEGQAANFEEAIAHIEHAIELYRVRVKDSVGEADCLVRLAQNAIALQMYSFAVACVNAAVSIYQSHMYLRGQARCMWLLGVISQERRINYVDASEKVADAAFAYRYLGDFTGTMEVWPRLTLYLTEWLISTGEANCLRILGRIALQTARYGDAIEYLQSAMILYRKVKRVYGEADCYQAQGEMCMGRRDESSAEPLFKQARALFAEINHRGGKVFCTRALGDIAFRQRKYALAMEIYEEALAMSKSHIDKCRAEFGIGNVLLALDEDNKAQDLYVKVLPVFQQHINAVPDEAHTLKKLGDVAVKAGDDEGAKGQFEQALVKFKLTGLVPTQADCLVRLAEVALRQSAEMEAMSRYEEAMGLYREIEDEERRMICSSALQVLQNVTPKMPWVRLL